MNETEISQTVATLALRGRVSNQGLPVAGVQILLYENTDTSPNNGFSAAPLAQVATDARGEYEFNIAAGSYHIELSPGKESRFLRASVPSIEVVGDTTQNFRLTTGAVLEGRVSTRSGAVPTGCQVTALGIEPALYQGSADIDSMGRYALVLPKGTYLIGCRSCPPAIETPENEEESEQTNRPSFGLIIVDSTTLTLTQDDRVDLTLIDPVLLNGQVTDVSGSPVGGAKITFSPAETMHSQGQRISVSCLSNASGKFLFAVQPGQYDVVVQPNVKDKHSALEEKNFQITKDLSHKFVLAEGHRLRGTAAYEEQPLSGALVRIESLDNKAKYMTRTEDNGQFSLSVPAGNYKLVVSAHPKDCPTVTINGAQYSGLAPWTRTIVVGGDTHVAIKIQQGTPLYGQFLDEAGEPIPGVPFAIIPDTGTDPTDTERALTVGVADGEGKYCVFLSSGKYWVVAHKDINSATSVTIAQDPVNMQVESKHWCELNFEIIGEDGYQVPRCRVICTPYTSDSNGSNIDIENEKTNGYLLTDDQGKCETMIPKGIYWLRFIPPSDSSYEEKVIRQLSVSSNLAKNVRLPIKVNS